MILLPQHGVVGGAAPTVTPDPYFAYTTLLVNGITDIVDESYSPVSLTVNGCVISDGAIYFDGVNDYIAVPKTLITSGSNYWTVEAFVDSTYYAESAPTVLATTNAYGAFMFAVRDRTSTATGKLSFGRNFLAWDYTSPALTINQGSVYHISVGRNGGYIQAFLNGVRVDAGTVALSNIFRLLSTEAPAIGARQLSSGGATPGNFFKGKMKGIRVTNGVCRYTTDYTPPSLPLPTS